MLQAALGVWGTAGPRGEAGLRLGLGICDPAQVEPRQQGMSLCRRNSKVGLSGMAIADVTLLSGFHALRADLEKVWSAIQEDPLCPQEPCSIPAVPPATEPCHVQGPGLPACDRFPSPQLTSLSDRYVSHFETEGPHVLLYFDSVSRER